MTLFVPLKFKMKKDYNLREVAFKLFPTITDALNTLSSIHTVSKGKQTVKER